MAFIDPDQPSLVLRMVYDGPALAGKTTNLEALAEGLGREIYSGEEAEGRTLYLDWVDYLGGSFEGMPIRCQLVSVPGQQVLHSRRRWLLEAADVVVFVADSRPGQAAENERSFALLQEVLRPKAPPVGLIVQANKRDVDGALDLESLRRQLSGDQPLAMTEAIATESDGVRDTFVFAVRLALDRVRALRQLGQLETRAPEVQDGSELVEALRRVEEGSRTSAAIEVDGAAVHGAPVRSSAAAFQSAPPASSGATTPPAGSGPALPDVMLPLGQVWPPVRGRIFIHEVTRQAPHMTAGAGGGWLAETAHWLLHSPESGLFEDQAAGQAALQGWVDWHDSMGNCLTQERGLALSQDGPSWRLWQVVGRRPTLGQDLDQLLNESEGEVLGRGLFRLLQQERRAPEVLSDLESMSWLDLGSNGAQEDEDEDETQPLRFAGLAPFPGPPLGSAKVRKPSGLSWTEELAPRLRQGLARHPGSIPGVLAGFQTAAKAWDQGAVAHSLRKILLGS